MTKITQEIKDTAILNDMLRQTLLTGEIRLSERIKALSKETQNQILDGIKNYNSFGVHGETADDKNMGGFSVSEFNIFWRIDCYNDDGVWTCLDRDNPDKVNRVMSISLMDESDNLL